MSKLLIILILKKMNATVKPDQECCPEFNPAPWDDKILYWDKKKFVRRSVLTFFYMPLNFGKVMRDIDREITEAGASVVDNMGLSDHTSKWNMDVYLATDKDIPGEFNTSLSGKYFCKVYEGPYKNTKKWCDDFDKRARDKNLRIDKMYMWYTTCPRCAKKYGKNYVAILGKIK